MPTLFLPGNRSIIIGKISIGKISGAIAIAIFLLLPASKGLTQEEVSPPPVTSQPTAPEEIPSDGLFFADVIVRGQPVFQIGSLGELSATERAQIVNRRIAGILAQSPTGSTVTVVADPERSIATLGICN
jgi:small conductance mechanosensitive channel